MRPTDPIAYLVLAILGFLDLGLCAWSLRLIWTNRRWADRAGLTVTALMAGGTAYLIWGLL